MNHLTHIEPLEPRISPATLINPYTVTFQNYETNSGGTQIQGDTVIVTISKPLFTSGFAAEKILKFKDANGKTVTETFQGNSTAENLSEINLLGRTDAQGLNISVKVVPQLGVGNMKVDVGDINAGNFANDQAAGNINLGNIYIQGNLGQITAGANFVTTAIKSLTVLSMNQDLTSTVLGPIGTLNVKGDFNSYLNLITLQFGSIGTLIIGGSLAPDANGDTGTGIINFSGKIGTATIGNITGGAASDTGELLGVTGDQSSIGSLHVLGSITGGSGANSGQVYVPASIGKVTVDGSVIGGSAGATNVSGFTGVIEADSIGSLNIGGSIIGGAPVTGGTADTSGAIVANTISTVKIGGSIIGGGGPNSGVIAGEGEVTFNIYGDITVGGNITGGAGANSGSILATGLFGGTIASLHVGGALTGGAGTNSGEVATNGSLGTAVLGGGVLGGSAANTGEINVTGSLTSLHIGGALTGSSGTNSGEVTAASLGTLYIGGNVTGGTANSTGEILVGGSLASATINGNLSGNGSTPISATTPVVGTGYIQAGHIGTLNITGNVTSGTDSAGSIANSGDIRSSTDILSLTIGGAVTGTSANPVIISAQQGPGTSAILKSDVAIQNITIDGAASYLDILAGYSPTVSTTSGSTTNATGAPLGTPIDGAAQIGTLHFLSTLSASNLVAGADPDSSGHFGTTGDTAIGPRAGADHLLSSIANIIVAGQATGDLTPADSFGFVAQKLGIVAVDGTNIPTGNLVAGTPVAVNGSNLFLLEVTS